MRHTTTHHPPPHHVLTTFLSPILRRRLLAITVGQPPRLLAIRLYTVQTESCLLLAITLVTVLVLGRALLLIGGSACL